MDSARSFVIDTRSHKRTIREGEIISFTQRNMLIDTKGYYDDDFTEVCYKCFRPVDQPNGSGMCESCTAAQVAA